MKRLIRFIKLLSENWGHIWWASQYRYATYFVHGTNDAKKHHEVKTHSLEHLGKADKIRKFTDKTKHVKGRKRAVSYGKKSVK